ncbi:hypothetical protein GCM10022255_098240 [Dactylosporangium darangshiense]|uniref:GNAT family N-acetyltransferase n=2 Tax=Dactylosporangium darangshiense TaxID=579108 RepID=A0ABP8DRP9_9ACTN
MVAIMPATPTHVPLILRLLQEMDTYYGDIRIDSDESGSAQVSEHLFGGTPSSQAIVAIDGNDVIGLASFSFVWPAQP